MNSDHSVAHDDSMGVTNAQGLTAKVGARLSGERPRAEVQPIQIGRERPVIAVQHGETLTSADNWRDEEVRRH